MQQGNDSVFMLSVEEVRKYFKGNNDRKAQGTEYAKVNNLWVSDWNRNSYWWLRTKGTDRSCAAVVTDFGSFYTDGYYVDDTHIGVRPALWVQI